MAMAINGELGRPAPESRSTSGSRPGCAEWATPHSNSHTGVGSKGEGGDNLQTQVVVHDGEDWPTPSSAGSTGGATGLAGGSGNRAKMKRIMGGEMNAKLNPDWVCCLMGVPVGWVHPTSVRNRTDELRLLGNGVVPQVAARAVTILSERFLTDKENTHE